jgi:hypothetical protein
MGPAGVSLRHAGFFIVADTGLVAALPSRSSA